MSQPVSPGQLSLLDLSPQSVPKVLSVAVPSRPAGRMRPEGPTRRSGVSSWPGPGDAGVAWMPAAPVDVAEYLTTLVGRGAGLATVRQAGAAHRTAGADSLTESEVVRLTMAGLDHQNRRAAVQAPALLDDAVVAILATARLHRERGRRAWKSPGRVALVLALRDCGLRRSEAAAPSGPLRETRIYPCRRDP